jgi:hypothetical protein
MTPRDSEHHALTHLLAALPDCEPRPQTSTRIRSCCHAVLEARRKKSARARTCLRVFEPALAAAVSLIFLTEVVRRALTLYGL